jgi:O-methyltransferase
MRTVFDLIPDIDHLCTRQYNHFPELAVEHEFWPLYADTKAFSMVHVSGYYNAYRSMQYLRDNKISGALVECGCFLGGMTAFLAKTRNKWGIKNPIYAFDTFTGFPVGSTDTFLGQPAGGPQFANYREAVVANITEAVGSLDGITLVEGPVEDTIPKTDVGPIAMLRLDTDHYDSTKVELDHYWPKLVPHGVIIVDDYGCFEGSRRATDEYFAALPISPMLNRIDGGVFSGIKPGQGSCPI